MITSELQFLRQKINEVIIYQENEWRKFKLFKVKKKKKNPSSFLSLPSATDTPPPRTDQVASIFM